MLTLIIGLIILSAIFPGKKRTRKTAHSTHSRKSSVPQRCITKSKQRTSVELAVTLGSRKQLIDPVAVQDELESLQALRETNLHLLAMIEDELGNVYSYKTQQKRISMMEKYQTVENRIRRLDKKINTLWAELYAA